jgi:hypothetical protein
VDLNDAILAAGGSNWRDWRKFSPEQMDGAVADALRARAKAALIDEFIGASLLVIKDPRICRLMPFWAPVFAEAEWSVCALLPIRSPLEVVWSLNCRDGISPGYGCLLWLRHVLNAEAETRGMTRAFLNWPQFLGEGREALARVTEQLGLIWRMEMKTPLLRSMNLYRPICDIRGRARTIYGCIRQSAIWSGKPTRPWSALSKTRGTVAS